MFFLIPDNIFKIKQVFRTIRDICLSFGVKIKLVFQIMTIETNFKDIVRLRIVLAF